MKIKTSEILISLMIIIFIGFVLFFVASHLARKKDIAIDEKKQISEKATTVEDVPKRPKHSPSQQTTPKKIPAGSQTQAITKTVGTTTALTKLSHKPEQIPKSPPPVQKTIQKDKIIQYETVRDKNKHPDHTLMNERKKTFGIKNSLDLIVKPDEKVQVGDAVAPIKKISERLQLDLGKIIEDNIDEPFQLPKQEKISQSKQNKSAVQDRLATKSQNPLIEKQLKKQLNQSSTPESIPIELGSPEKPANEQAKSIPGYPYINDASLKIKKLLKTISKQPANELKLPSVGDISPETNLNIYPPQSPKPYEISTYLGIRVVQPGTNIWEIHFDLLKEYFQHKGVILSPHADEPTKSGESSGVGKILKFSEQLVNIYNLKTQTFEHDLNVIQPLSVIVIYNMSQIFGVLDDIDYSVIDRIEFDGEALWIPSVQ
jgi:hypothetical protein